ncbi:MAG: hypothetical protein J6C89_00190, partial [Clostridia bacterium]|nr:hypothetical protein [Clostridia bacterium]
STKIQILFWSITYILIIAIEYTNLGKKTPAMPFNSCMMNLAWESTALFLTRGFWGHIIWWALDLFIFAYSVYCTKSIKKCLLYILCFIGCLIMFFCFSMHSYGMLISSFIIDLTMSIFFWISRKRILKKGKVIIALTKLCGDFFALLYYAKFHIIVVICGLSVLVVNIAYLVYCILEKYKENNKLCS